MLGRARKSDILVTPEKSAELAKPKFQMAPRQWTQHTRLRPCRKIRRGMIPRHRRRPRRDRGGHRPRWGQAARPDNRAAALALPINGNSAASSGPFSRPVKARRKGMKQRPPLAPRDILQSPGPVGPDGFVPRLVGQVFARSCPEIPRLRQPARSRLRRRATNRRHRGKSTDCRASQARRACAL